MPETISLPDGATLKWSGKELEKAAREQVYGKLLLACEHVKGLAVKNVSKSARSNGPSREGEYPHADTGRLRNSIFASVDEKTLEGIVGTNLKYGLWLEYGTRGGRVITAKGGKMLSWLGKGGRRVFAKSVTLGPIKGRSYLRRTFVEAQPKLRKFFGEQWPDLKAG